jgi:hypothetical protein
MTDTDSNDAAQALSLLAGIREGLVADGYDFVVRSDGGRLDIEVVATESACADCLVPEAMMQAMIQATVGPQFTVRSLTYPAATAGTH